MSRKFIAPTMKHLRRLRIHGLGHVPMCADVQEAHEVCKRNDWAKSLVLSREWPNEWVLSVRSPTHVLKKNGKFKRVE